MENEDKSTGDTISCVSELNGEHQSPKQQIPLLKIADINLLGGSKAISISKWGENLHRAPGGPSAVGPRL